MSEKIITSTSGAKSSEEPDYSLLPTQGLLRAIERFQYGIAKGYDRDNWRKGLQDPIYLRERLSHMIGHAFKLRDAIEKSALKLQLSREELDDHVGAILWFGMFASCHAKVQELDLLRAIQVGQRHGQVGSPAQPNRIPILEPLKAARHHFQYSHDDRCGQCGELKMAVVHAQP